jgi:hypothetical protein
MLIATVFVWALEPVAQAAQLGGDLGRPAGLHFLRPSAGADGKLGRKPARHLYGQEVEQAVDLEPDAGAMGQDPICPGGEAMGRTYNVVDADGHILEPLDLWDHYMDPKFRDRAPRIVKGENGRERLIIAEHTVGAGERGIGSIGAVGARQGVVAADTMEYKDGKPGGFDPHKRIPDMDADGIDAAFLYPSLGLFAGAIHDP